MSSPTDGAPAHRRQDVSFASGGETLAGALVVPAADGPHPAVVMLQGSGAADRDNNGYFPPIREHFIRHGLAVLGYDKPGVGGSSGDWRRETLHDLAEHAVTAVRFLRSREGIAADLVGLWGHSEGGWVALAAAAAGDLPFVVAQSAPGITPMEQVAYAVEHEMRRDGFAEHEIARGVACSRALLEAARADVPFEQVDKAVLRDARGKSWYGYLEVGNADDWGFLLGMAKLAFDPVQVLERIACPVLATFGERDVLLPASTSAEIFAQALERAGNRDVTIEVFAGADHRIRTAEGEFAPGYLDLVTTWILRRARGRPPLSALTN
jgi:pimeloyl-ACP methyl ester carboxylesterase